MTLDLPFDLIFNLANLLALLGWALLILAPRPPVILAAIFYGIIGILCTSYAVLLVGVLTGLLPAGESGADFTSIEGIRSIFESDAGVTIGWIHYLAFDLFVGLWIAKDADDKSFSRLWQAPVLLATLIAGPLGLLIWLIVREPRARIPARGEIRRR